MAMLIARANSAFISKARSFEFFGRALAIALVTVPVPAPSSTTIKGLFCRQYFAILRARYFELGTNDPTSKKFFRPFFKNKSLSFNFI